MEKSRFTGKQKKLIVLLFFAYFLAYTMRVNISVALPSIQESLNISSQSMGFVTSAFFWAYAAGQILSGVLGDRIEPKYMVGTGLLGSVATSAIFSFCTSVTSLVVLWAINGIFQSMLWAPITRAISSNFEGEVRNRAQFIMSFTLILGYAVSWLSSALIVENLGWGYVFLIPAAVSLLFVVIWFIFFEKTGVSNTNKPRGSVKSLIVFLVIMCSVCILHGAVKEGVNIWLPTILGKYGGVSVTSKLKALAITPAISFAGVSFTKLMYSKQKGNPYKTLLIIFAIAVLFPVLAILFKDNAVVLIVSTIAICGLMSAMNPLLTLFIPIDSADGKNVSTIAGISDAAIYVGAAVFQPITGSIVDGNDLSQIALMWAVILVLGIGTGILLFINRKKNS